MSYGDLHTDDVKLAILAERVNKALRIIGCHHIVCTGTSGLLMATALRTRYPNTYDVLYVRKAAGSHGFEIEGVRGPKGELRCLLDDFIASGETASRVWRKMQEEEEYDVPFDFVLQYDEFHTNHFISTWLDNGTVVFERTEYRDRDLSIPVYWITDIETAEGFAGPPTEEIGKRK